MHTRLMPTQTPKNRLCAVALASLLLILSACGGGKKTPTANANVRGAADAARMATQLQSVHENAPRPSASMGVFVDVYLAGGILLPARGALEAAINGSKMIAKPSRQEINEAFDLLQEFGTVLQVDVPDILNRSDNRSNTLDTYLTALANITARATTRATELAAYLDTLKKQEQDQRKVVSDIDSAARKALQAGDYATSGAKQQDLATEQAKLAQLSAQVKEQEQIQSVFKDLQEIAAKRKDSIEKNREAILSGLTVVDVPGVEDLGVLEQGNRGGIGSFRF